MRPVVLSSFFLIFIFSSLLLADDSKKASAGLRYELILEGVDVIWGFEFLDSSQLILNERSGKIWLYDLKTQQRKSITHPFEVSVGGQGGLLDVRKHYRYPQEPWLYFSYSYSSSAGRTTRLSRAKLKDGSLVEAQHLFTAQPFYREGHHFGSRIVFDQKGHVFLSVGDRGNRDLAQSLKTHNGKIIRLKEDGQIPKDNPFINQKDALPEIWSYGHRNQQGLYFDVKTQSLWGQEHGPRGGDEINKIEKGGNYGWPKIGYGREYISRLWVGDARTKKGYRDPEYQFTPSIAPSGFVLYRGNKIPVLEESFISGALALQHLNQLKWDEGKKQWIERRYAQELGERIRDVRQGPDDLLYFSTDSGRLYRVSQRDVITRP